MLPSETQDGVRIVVEPESCLHDEPVSVRATGLQPGQQVTIQASMTETRGVKFISYAYYTADNEGMVDVEKMESEGGHYKGVFPMGLIGTLQPAPTEYQYTRFFKRDVENPNIVKVSIHEGHLSGEELCQPTSPPPLASMMHQRHYMGPGVQRIPVRYGRVRGCLFLPQGPGPFPGVVDMFGTAGGLLEYRSAQLATRGFAALALAFFAYDDLPKTLEAFDIAYFEEAVEFLMKHEKEIVLPHILYFTMRIIVWMGCMGTTIINSLNVIPFSDCCTLNAKLVSWISGTIYYAWTITTVPNPHSTITTILSHGVGVIGTSKGGDLALSMASFIPDVIACVTINGCSGPVGVGMKVRDHVCPPIPSWDYSKIHVTDEGIVELYNASVHPSFFKDSALPIEKSNAAFLFLVGADDRDLKSEMYAQDAFKRLSDNKHPKQYEIFSLPGAGHLIEPPYSPHSHASFQHSQMLVICWGALLSIT